MESQWKVISVYKFSLKSIRAYPWYPREHAVCSQSLCGAAWCPPPRSSAAAAPASAGQPGGVACC